MSESVVIKSQKPYWAKDQFIRHLLGSLGAALLAGTFLLSRATIQVPACQFRSRLGLPCPGCGLTRSMIALWHCDCVTSFRFHPLGIPILAASVIVVLRAFCPERWPRAHRVFKRYYENILDRRALNGFAVAVIVLWLLRLGLDRTGHTFFNW